MSAGETILDNPGFGTLIKLPREIRDEIYRYLVKGRFLPQGNLDPAYNNMNARAVSRSRHSCLAIFQVSKATYEEATSIYYSESGFRYDLDLFLATPTNLPVDPPLLFSNRMMKIEIDFSTSHFIDHWYGLFTYGVECGLKATLDKMTGVGHLRNSLLLKFKLFSPDDHAVVSDLFFGRLKTLVGFRTVAIEIGPVETLIDNGLYRTKNLSIVQAMKEAMVPTMGPASESCVGINILLEFHPYEHMRANLSDQAQKLQLKWMN